MERRWVVHIVDTRDGTRREQCVRCGEVLDVNQTVPQEFGAGTLLGIRHDQDRTEWRQITDRDDLAADEVACDAR
jgi:hypothetical protein